MYILEGDYPQSLNQQLVKPGNLWKLVTISQNILLVSFSLPEQAKRLETENS